MRGCSDTLIAYGQIGTGETYTMKGEVNEITGKVHHGIISRALVKMLDLIEKVLVY